MKLAVVSCANGLGHLKRMVRILNQLVDRGFLGSITLFCESSGLQKISEWNGYRSLRERCPVEAVDVSLPVRWKLNEDDYGDWLLDWHSTTPLSRLRNFDYVLSDNLVEPLLYSERVTLSGSFLWHDVLSTAYPGSTAIERYKSRCESVLGSAQPHLIANRYFATPAVLKMTNARQVGLIPFCKARENHQTSDLPRRVLMALGGAQLPNEIVGALAVAARRMLDAGIDVFASQSVLQSLRSSCPGIRPSSFGDDNFRDIDLAIIRGGLGTISDCIASKVPMLYADDPNPEIKHNQARLNEMGIGISLDQFLNGGADILTNQLVYRRMVSNMSGMSLNGHIEAADALAGIWGIEQSRQTASWLN